MPTGETGNMHQWQAFTDCIAELEAKVERMTGQISGLCAEKHGLFATIAELEAERDVLRADISSIGIHALRECWDTYGAIANPGETTQWLSSVDDDLRELERIVEQQSQESLPVLPQAQPY